MAQIADQRPAAFRTESEASFTMRLEEMLEGRRDLFLESIRIYLGLGLIAKGIYFLVDREFVGGLLLETGGLNVTAAFLSHYIPIAHIAGGALMAVGLLTRLGALIQLPILFGAIFFVHLRDGLFTRGQALEFTVLVLFLLALFVVVGSGRWSLDRYFRQRRIESGKR